MTHSEILGSGSGLEHPLPSVEPRTTAKSVDPGEWFLRFVVVGLGMFLGLIAALFVALSMNLIQLC